MKCKKMMYLISVSLCRRFGTKCAGCSQGISPSDLVRRARSKVFHLNCFTCMVCNKQLSTGEELYVIDENKFVCKEDFTSASAIKEVNLNSGEHDDARACHREMGWKSLTRLCKLWVNDLALIFYLNLLSYFKITLKRQFILNDLIKMIPVLKLIKIFFCGVK